MPYVWRPPERFLTYRGVTIYHAYKDDLSDVALDFWYSTSDCESPGSAFEFEIRELPGFRGRYDCLDQAEHRRAIRQAIAAGLLLNEVPFTGRPCDETPHFTLG